MNEDNIRRLSLPGCRSDRLLHVGDLIYIKSDSPAPYVRFVQLAVLRRIHRSGCKVDVQLCEISPPEMGTNGVDRIRLRAWLRGLPTTSVLGGVEPLVFADPNSVPPQRAGIPPHRTRAQSLPTRALVDASAVECS